MPCISRFYGILIYLYAGDHNPPHFHAKYAGQDVAIQIETLEAIAGEIPRRAMQLVLEWARQHRSELLSDWQLLQSGQPAIPIEPLP